MDRQQGPIPPGIPPYFQPPYQQWPAAPAAAAHPVDPNNPIWGIPTGVLVWVASIVLLILLNLFFVLPLIAGRAWTSEELKHFLLTDPKAVFMQILSVIPAHLLTLGVVWAAVTRFGKRPFLKSLGLDRTGKLGAWKSAAIGAVLFVVGTLLLNLIGPIKTSFDQTVSSSRSTAYLIAFLAFATAPIVEEVVYRGVLYSSIHKKFGAGWATACVLLLFTAVHVPQYWPDFARIGFLGFLSLSLTLVRAYTGRLLPCLIIHTVFNGIQSMLIVAEPYLPTYLKEPDPQPAAALLAHIFNGLF